MALFGLLAAPALAQNTEPAPATAAPMKSKPRTPPGEPTVTLMVTNSRKTDLVELQAAESGSASLEESAGRAESRQTGVGQTAAEASIAASNLHGTFANGESMDATDVDVCAQKTLNLTD